MRTERETDALDRLVEWLSKGNNFVYTMMMASALFAAFVYIMVQWSKDPVEKAENAIRVSITKTERECQELASTAIKMEILTKKRVLEKDEIEDALEDYQDMEKSDCELMNRQIEIAEGQDTSTQ